MGNRMLRQYTLRDEHRHWLARVVTADDGYFSVVSQHGNYAYQFDPGVEFREFLCSLEPDYLCGKIAHCKEYDGEATLQSVKREVLDKRRRGSCTRGEAREEWDLLAEHNDLESREDFALWYQDTKIHDASEHACRRYPHDVTAFAARVWPVLTSVLRAELEDERERREGEVRA